MGKVVREKAISPLLELLPLDAREEERFCEGDRRVPVRPDRVDAKHACRLPMTPGAPVMLD